MRDFMVQVKVAVLDFDLDLGSCFYVQVLLPKLMAVCEAPWVALASLLFL